MIDSQSNALEWLYLAIVKNTNKVIGRKTRINSYELNSIVDLVKQLFDFVANQS